MRAARLMALLLLAALLSTGCARSAHQSGRALLDRVIAPDLQRQVDESVTYSNVAMSPEAYVGKTVMFSGIALKAKRAKDRTEIEILQLPAEPGSLPTVDRSRSEGRFLAVQEGFLDPATIEEGTPVTVVGEVQGTTTRPLDEAEYTYPVVKIDQLVDWNKTREREYAGGFYPFFGGYYRPYPYLWGGPYGYGYYPYGYGYGLWGPYYPLLFNIPSVGAAPSPPAASSVPPQFRRRD